jgi:hypothetical protein
MWRGISKAVRDLLEIPGYSSGSYRPDKYYMRGPCPKWHAKYDSLIEKTSQSSAPSRTVLSDVAGHRA